MKKRSKEKCASDQSCCLADDDSESSSSESEDDETAARGPYKSWKIQDLKEELRRRNLSARGLKDDLVNRLIANDTMESWSGVGLLGFRDSHKYGSKKKEYLQAELRERNLSDQGLKDDLINRLIANDKGEM